MIELHPIGTVRSELKKPTLRAGKDGITLDRRLEEARREFRRIRELESEIEVDPAFGPLLDGIEDFSHILVLYWPHLVPPERRSLQKIHPMGREEFPETGIFATCSPARPNPVLVTAVRLLERKGDRLRVRGLDAVDGSPVVDIKPFVPENFRVEEPAFPEWMERIRGEMDPEK